MESLHYKLSLMRSHGLCVTCECFIRLLSRYGLRINDMRSIKRTDILSTNIIKVKQSKGSNELLCPIVEDFVFWSEYKAGLHTDISLFTYSFFYKLFMRYALYIESEKGGNRSVTHSCRKSLARQLYNETGDINISKIALGHKSQKSTQYYLTKEQQKCEIKRGILTAQSGQISNITTKKRWGKTFIYISK